MGGTFVVDLSGFRFGMLVKFDRFPNVDNTYFVKYRPLRKFGTREIINIPAGGFIEVRNSDVGGISDFENFLVILKSEGGSNYFFENILLKKYTNLARRLEEARKEIEIRKGIESIQRYQYSKDVMKKISELTDVINKLKNIRTDKRRPIFGRHEY